MPYAVKPEPGSHYVELELIGRMTKEDIEEARDAAGRALSANDWILLLVNATRAEPDMGTLDHFELAAEHGPRLPPGTRHAVVTTPDAPTDFGFIENVSRNRGVDFRVFVDREAAISWLVEAEG